MIYIMSDIHGHYDKYLKMLKKINFNESDTLYIIGDAIDRGPKSMELLLDIMSRNNVKFMLGNHEFMMLNALDSNEELGAWCMNGGEETYNAFESLDEFSKHKVVSFLRNTPVVYPCVKVDGQKFYFAHSSPLTRYEVLPLKMSSISEREMYRVVWERIYNDTKKHYPGYEESRFLKLYNDTIFICGHTMVKSTFYGRTDKEGNGKISKAYRNHVINIDCGCGAGYNLGCLCLNTMKEYYVR